MNFSGNLLRIWLRLNAKKSLRQISVIPGKWLVFCILLNRNRCLQPQSRSATVCSEGWIAVCEAPKNRVSIRPEKVPIAVLPCDDPTLPQKTLAHAGKVSFHLLPHTLSDYLVHARVQIHLDGLIKRVEPIRHEHGTFIWHFVFFRLPFLRLSVRWLDAPADDDSGVVSSSSCHQG